MEVTIDTSLQNELLRLGACPEAIAWCEGKSLAEAWSSCERADWMLWLLAKKLGCAGWPDRKQVVRLACACAETALRFVPEGEERPRKAIEAARAWCDGRASLAEVCEAAAAATEADSYASASSAAAAYTAAAEADTEADDAEAVSTAYTASVSADATYAAEAAAYAAAGAAYSVTYAATNAAYAAAYAYAAERERALREMSELIRTEIPSL